MKCEGHLARHKWKLYERWKHELDKIVYGSHQRMIDICLAVGPQFNGYDDDDYDQFMFLHSLKFFCILKKSVYWSVVMIDTFDELLLIEMLHWMILKYIKNYNKPVFNWYFSFIKLLNCYNCYYLD